MGNGSVESGEGYLYRGRGLFQYTGKEGYLKLGGKKLVDNPDLALVPSMDVKYSVAFWKWKGLEKRANSLGEHIDIIVKNNITAKGEITKIRIVKDENFKRAVSAVNGGDNGIADRAESYNRYLRLFNR